MSGGHFDYNEHYILEIIAEIESLIEENEYVDLNGNKVGRFYSEKTLSEFKKALNLLRISFIYIHRIDYLVSGDDREEVFQKRLRNSLVGFEDE